MVAPPQHRGVFTTTSPPSPLVPPQFPSIDVSVFFRRASFSLPPTMFPSHDLLDPFPAVLADNKPRLFSLSLSPALDPHFLSLPLASHLLHPFFLPKRPLGKTWGILLHCRFDLTSPNFLALGWLNPPDSFCLSLTPWSPPSSFFLYLNYLNSRQQAASFSTDRLSSF